MTTTHNRWIGLWIIKNSETATIRSFKKITFYRGKAATISWNDGTEVEVKTSP
jgi:hypothetical protein